ncbi:MAG TPA: choice-of-anchor X domain-containing protein [Thermoanaerobaculia bacterium]|nr:choice-of-anchor X domain-containing protein [Thermoanaerobaculia bacterium]
MRFRQPVLSALVLGLAVMGSGPSWAQDPRPGQPGFAAPAAPIAAAGHFGSSPFDPPEKNDATFVVDQDSGLDTGCTFRGGGPLVFKIKVGRVIGDKAKLKQNGLISEMAELNMPAFDVDFDAIVPPYSPERDRVTFNGNPVPSTFLTGSNNTWKLNAFQVPIDWVNFATPGANGGSPTAGENTIQIDIDTANSEEVWCTSIDWAALSVKVVRPVVMAHGILSDPSVWNPIWKANLDALGILNDTGPSMGKLDSIQSNAAKIGNSIAQSRQRWGVDKVNLVVHSKGGLDSRHYVEGNKDVEQVIQLGTPNAGSPLADVAHGLKTVLLGRLGPIGAVINLISDLALPAGYQLTTKYMSLYNAFHGSNPKVQYTALAGVYDPGCSFFNIFCHPIDRVLLLITGRGDTIVPQWSVHALSYTSNLTHPSRGSDGSAKHTSLEKAQSVYDRVKGRVTVFGTNSSLVADASDPIASRTATTGGLINQGETQTWTIPVDSNAPVFFTLSYGVGDLNMVLISPSGQRFDPTNTVQHEKAAALGGFLEVYNFDQPEVGEWTVQVTGTSASGGVAYAVNAWFDHSGLSIPSGGVPGIVLAGDLPRPSIHANEALPLTGVLRKDGVPLLGASVKAIVALPDSTTREVVLHDDGLAGDAFAEDGVYSGQFLETAQPGTYEIVIQAFGTGLVGTPDFSREDFALATVSRSSSNFAGTFRDHGLDTDGDGLFNQLIVDVDVNLTAAGSYRVFGVLTDAQGNTHQASTLATFPAGLGTVSLSFDGEAIFQNRVDGPYTLSVIRMAEESDLDLLPVDERTGAFQTTAYAYRQFQHAPILLGGGGSSVGIDTNGNGLFDLLRVRIGADVDFDGFYNWSARLEDANGNELGFAASSAFLSTGHNEIELTYDGQAIGRNGVDGPYFVRSLLMFGAGRSLVAADAFITDAFLASQFEGYSIDHTPPVLSVTLSPTVLWPPNHQLQEVVAKISVTDDKDPHPAVRLVSITSSEPDNGLGDGDTPNDIQQADFGTDDRQFLLRAERSGTELGRTYTITYEAEDAAGNTSQVSVKVMAPHDRPR